MFVDEAEIEVQAGAGGDGAATLRHEKFAPRGGPDGGDGGRGGAVVAVADPHLRTLVDFSYHPHYRAEAGGRGGRNQRRGKNGAELMIRVPVGTVVREADSGRVIADLAAPDQRTVLARGGRAGRGNVRFATSTRRTPRFAEKGEPGEHRRLRLELKLLADVGLVGLPNAGKSSLLARVSAARPKIAEYPFTTLAPNLGVVRFEEGTSFVIADLPGLIEGAHQGAGRGHDFLRHVERTRMLVHVLDVGGPEADPEEGFATVNRELERYHPELARRPQVVALNKLDLRPAPDLLARVRSALEAQGYQVFPISAVTGEGVQALLGRVAELLAGLPESPSLTGEPEPPAPREETPLRVSQIGEGVFAVAGTRVERVIVMTDLANQDAVRYLHRRLERMGVIRRLRGLGAKDGDRVRIGEVELEFVD